MPICPNLNPDVLVMNKSRGRMLVIMTPQKPVLKLATSKNSH